MLGYDIAAALPELRAHAESMMQDECVIVRDDPDAAPVWDETLGEYGDQSLTVVYEGPCRLRRPAAAPQSVVAAETTFAKDQPVLSLPIESSGDVRDGDRVTITASAHDPAAVGLDLTIQGGHWQTLSSARRFSVTVVTRDA